MTCKLIVSKGYKDFSLRFDTLVEAGEFINMFSRHVLQDRSENDRRWKYTIVPILEDDSDEVEDDIPVN